MIRSIWRAIPVAAAGALLLFSVGCSDSFNPVSPPESPAAPVQPSAPVQPIVQEFPPLSHSGQVYQETGSIYSWIFSYHGGNLASRYILYDDGTIGLQFMSPRFGFFEYGGRRQGPESDMTFTFSGDGRWFASARLDGSNLTVAYNDIMMMSDFVDGVYMRAPAQ